METSRDASGWRVLEEGSKTWGRRWEWGWILLLLPREAVLWSAHPCLGYRKIGS